MYLDPIDRENPISILHMTRGKLQEAVLAVPDDIGMMTEKELRKELKPTSVDYCLRVSFWREYEAAVREKREYIAARTVLLGICSDAYFYQKFLKDPFRVAWLVKPVQAYMKEIEAVLLRGTERLWELVDIDIEIEDKRGNKVVCSRLATVLLETIKMIEARAKGHAMQRSEMRAVSLNLNEPHGVKTPTDHHTLTARLKELSEKLHGSVILGAEAMDAVGVGEPVEGN